MTAGSWLLPAALLAVAALVAGPRWPKVWLGLTLGAAAAALGAAMIVLLGADWEWRGSMPVGGECPHLRLDGVSAFFLVLVAVVGAAGAVYAAGYWPEAEKPKSVGRGRFWWTFLLAAMGLVLVNSNGLHFLISWELFALSAFFLITLENRHPAVRRAGWLYLAASHAGTLLLFAFFGLLVARTGGWDLGPMREKSELAPLFWLALVGFGLKAGVFPLHVWLPSAHSNAPSHVSALLSGVAIKMGLYGIVRFSGWLPLPEAAGWTVLALGAASAVLGIAFALAQNDLKRLLAYCSVENMGILLAGLGASLVAMRHGDSTWGRLVLAGFFLHIWNHGAFKALLFFGAGSVLHATGTKDMSRLGGLWRRMPWTTCLFGIGALAVAGLPSLNGFVSEWLVYLGLLDAAAGHDPAAVATMPAILLLAVAGALALATFAKAATIVFLGAPRTKPAAQAHECGPWMRGPMVGLAALCLALGLLPVVVWPVLARASASWNPLLAPNGTPDVLCNIMTAQFVVLVMVSTAGFLLWKVARARGLRRGPTWDCGYAAPGSRMQYSSGSWGATASGWFFWILRTERKVRGVRGPWPAEARRLERTPETVLENVLGPTGRGVLRVSTAVRRFQHGRLQSYILFVVAGLVALGIMVWLGGAR